METTIECSPAVGSVQPSLVGAFSTPLLSRRTRSSKFHFCVKVDAHDILPDELKKWADYANYIQHRIIVGRMYWQTKKTFDERREALSDPEETRQMILRAYDHLLTAETSCNFYWGSRWVHRSFDDLEQTYYLLDAAMARLGEKSPGEKGRSCTS